MIIAFMGNDGSGKTTAIKLLQTRLSRIGERVIYVPGFSHFFLDKIKLFYQRFTGADMKKMQSDYSDSERKKKNLLFYIWPYFIFFDCLCLLVKYSLATNEFVLFDRYFYDYVATFKNLGINSKLVENIFLILPKQKYSYIFDASASVAYERKKDSHSGGLKYYEDQRKRYLWLAEKKHIQIINTDHCVAQETADKIFNDLQGAIK